MLGALTVSTHRAALGLIAGAWVCAAACGGSDDPPAQAAGTDAQVLPCDPVAQTGCMAGEKCTWIVDIDGDPVQKTNEVGHIGCAAAGSISAGAACTDAVSGASGGVDGCVAGELCVAQTCKPICDPQLVDGAAPGACAASYACSTYGGIFESGGDPVAGVCEPGCDPLTQQLNFGPKTAACGSSNPAQPSQTCVASEGYRSFHCAPSSPELYANTDRVAPFTTASGALYSNSCAPGFIPFYYEDASGAMTTLCTGLCAPLPADATIVTDPAHRNDAKGDARALGKLPTDATPLAGRSTCNVGVKGSEAAEDCRFLWFPLAHGDPSHALDSPYNDTLGVCFAYQRYLTVTIPGMSQKVAEKSCAELPATAPANDPYGSARDNGCYPLADSLGADVRSTVHYRLANGSGAVARHIFD